MKKILICFLLQFIILSGIFSNAKVNTNVMRGDPVQFRMPDAGLRLEHHNGAKPYSQSDDPLKWQSRKKGGSIALTAVGSVLTTAGLGMVGFTVALGVMETFTKMYQAFFAIPMTAHLLLLAGSILMYLGIYRLHTLSVSGYNAGFWREQMSKVAPTIGIILMATSVVPLAGAMAAVGYLVDSYRQDPSNESLMVQYCVPLVILGVITLAQLITGGCLIGHYYYRLSEWAVKSKIMPELAITHDDTKDYTEGYGVSVGMRVRI